MLFSSKVVPKAAIHEPSFALAPISQPGGAEISPAAYAFLEKYRGLAFLTDCYDIEHTQSIQTAVDDMSDVCIKNGGVFA